MRIEGQSVFTSFFEGISSMRAILFRASMGVVAFLGLASIATADDYAIDTAHTSVSFKIEHMGLSHVHGRFNSFSGSFRLDSSDAANNFFKLDIKSQSVDTNNPARDTHLKSPEYFNARQYASVSFKSTSVKPVDGGYEVNGDLTLRGETKPVAFTLKGGKTAQFQGGTHIGFSTDFVIKRSDFAVGKPSPALGDDVMVSIGLEGLKKK
jgi:polyisoprenoid-binding protein YceI